MSFLNKLLGFRWSLYVVYNDKLAYAMHEHSVVRMLGCVVDTFAEGRVPIEPWSLHLNFNRNNQTIKLGSEHFTQNGDLSPILIQQISSIDPGYMVKGGEPVCEEAATKKRIKLYPTIPRVNGLVDIHAMLNNIDKPRELTFSDILDEVFEKK